MKFYLIPLLILTTGCFRIIDGGVVSQCRVTTLDPSTDNPTGGAKIVCGDTTSILLNGAPNGSSSAFVVVGAVDPCGNFNGSDEIFLRTADGKLVAFYTSSSNALNARLSYLQDGTNYQTTDDQHCNFSLSTDSNGLRTLTTTSPVAGVASWQTY